MHLESPQELIKSLQGISEMTRNFTSFTFVMVYATILNDLFNIYNQKRNFVSFCFILFCFETGSLYVTLAVLELAM